MAIGSAASEKSTRVVKVDEPWMGYDYIARLHVSSLGLKLNKSKKQPDETAFFDKANEIYDVLQRGLGDRVVHLNIVVPKSRSLDLTGGHLDVGLVAEPSVALRAIDRGPAPEDEKAVNQFRKLWGSKSELRRFKDGAIQESVVWTSSEARDLLAEIIRHLIATHVSMKASQSLQLQGNDFNAALPAFTSRLAIFEPIAEAYRSLEKDIRSLDELPLAIRQISPADSALSSSAVHLPFAADGRHARPMDVVLQFEASARWPDDLQAIQMTKIAFLLKMQELMTTQRKQSIARIGLENEHSDILNRSFLEVALPAGLVFRVRIHHDREPTLLDRILKASDSEPAEREAAAFALAAYRRDFERRPTHCQALQATITRHPALSGTIRLVKRWFNAHMLGSHFRGELIEIMCLRAFVHAHPWKPPSSPQTGFLRTLLFLSRWNWEQEPLLVDLDGNATSEALATARTRFQAWRKIDPAMNRVVLFAATNLDTDGSTWTERSPTKVVANRMTSLAAAALASVNQQGVEIDTSRLFKPSIKGYDFRINLSKRFKPSKKAVQGVSKFKNLQQQTVLTDSSLAGFQPVKMFIDELCQLYGEVMVLFYDQDGGSVICGVWDPTKIDRRWKVNLPYSTKPVDIGDDDVTATVNRRAILNEIARLGGDMIESIDGA